MYQVRLSQFAVTNYLFEKARVYTRFFLHKYRKILQKIKKILFFFQKKGILLKQGSRVSTLK